MAENRRGPGRLRTMLGRVARQPRGRLAAIGAGLCVLALAGTLIVFAAQPSAPAQRAQTVMTATIVTTVAAATATPTNTPTVRPTTGTTRLPGKLNARQSVVVPPPPPLPTPPPQASPTPCPIATATPTPTGTVSAGATPAATPTATCTPCGQHSGNNPSQAVIQAALDNAAAKYGLPPRLLYAVAWQETNWHQDIVSCDGGVGLMQVQYYTYPWLNKLSQSGCDVAITPTSYNDPYNSVQDNAYLGAKYLAWLKCLYAYNAQGGGSASAPANGSTEYDYFNAGNPDLAYPDLTTFGGQQLSPCAPPSAAGTPTPSTVPSPTPIYGACSLCLSLYQDNTNGPTTTLYQDLADKAGIHAQWGCPFDPTKGISDYELLDLTLSAYNAGPGSISNCGCIPNLDYVGNVEYWVTEFANGQLPA